MPSTVSQSALKDYFLIGGSRDGERVSIDDACDVVRLVDLGLAASSFSRPTCEADKFNGIPANVEYQRRYLPGKDGRLISVFAVSGMPERDISRVVLGV